MSRYDDETRHRLHGCWLKVRRANEHLHTLDDEISRFLSSEDRRLIAHFEPDTSQYISRVRGGPPPLRWGIILGEFAHLLRSTLDNLLWQLILARGNQPKGRPRFPIHDKVPRDGWKKATSERPAGISHIVIDNCTLENCEFENVGFAGQPEFIAEMRRGGRLD